MDIRLQFQMETGSTNDVAFLNIIGLDFFRIAISTFSSVLVRISLHIWTSRKL